jgi:hypothetical protein
VYKENIFNGMQKFMGKLKSAQLKLLEVYEILESKGFGCNAQW